MPASDQADGVRIAVVDARDGPCGRTFLAGQGFGSCLDAFEMRRFALIAALLRARVVVVETPAFGPSASRLLPAERRALRSGDFGPLAARMLDAAAPDLSDVADGRLSFLGYSLGASIAAAMARAATAACWAVDHLVLVEPVGLRTWRTGSLLAATWRESRWDTTYRSDNPAVLDGFPPSPRRGADRGCGVRSDQLLLGAALRRGGIPHDVLNTTPPPHRTIVVSAERSTLGACRNMERSMSGNDRHVGVLTVPGHHGFWHSLPAVEAMTRRLALAISGSPDRATV